jgi:hypothetical protein
MTPVHSVCGALIWITWSSCRPVMARSADGPRAHSGLSAVVVRFSRSRRPYERQGVLVEEDALARAEAECLADEEKRSRSRT